MRIVSFANGLVVKERIVGIDAEAQRVSYSAFDGKATYHFATMTIVPEGHDRSKLIWQTRFLPAELEPFIAQNMKAGSQVMKSHLERLQGERARRRTSSD